MKAHPVKAGQAMCHGNQPGTSETVRSRYVKCATPKGINARPYSTLAMRRPLSPVANLSRCRSRSPANHTYSTQEAAAITAVSPRAHQVTVAVGALKISGALNNSSQTKNELSSTREAMRAVRGQSRPMPDTGEMKAQRQASPARAGGRSGTPDQARMQPP